MLYQKLKLTQLLSELFSYKILKNNLIKQIIRTEAASVFLFWGGMFPNQLKKFLRKIKKELILTDFALFMHMITEQY